CFATIAFFTMGWRDSSSQESMQLQLKGLLCFQMIQNISQMSDCVQLYLLKLMLPGFEGCCLPGYPRVMALYVPNLDGPPLFYRSVPDSLPPWEVKNYFSFSPYIGTVHNSSFSGYNWTYQNPAQVGASNPFNVWLLCGVNGSCTDLSLLSMVAGGA
ncbi:mCG144846, partial [Mus musculus]